MPTDPHPNFTILQAEPNLGDLVIILLAGTLTGLHDRLIEDKFPEAATLVQDMVDLADDYLANITKAPTS